MATAPLKMKKQGKEMTRFEIAAQADSKPRLTPLLAVMLAALVIFPFIAGFLPQGLREYLGVLFR